jgi:hypothetical protein
MKLLLVGVETTNIAQPCPMTDKGAGALQRKSCCELLALKHCDPVLDEVEKLPDESAPCVP